MYNLNSPAPNPKDDVPYSVTAQEMYEKHKDIAEEMSDKLLPRWEGLSLDAQNFWLSRARDKRTA